MGRRLTAFKPVRLVTSYYHMPRATLLMEDAAPRCHILPKPGGAGDDQPEELVEVRAWDSA